MQKIYILGARISLYLRFAQTLKDRRKVSQSLIQKARNLGFSVAEASADDSPKQAKLAVSFSAFEPSALDIAQRELKRLLIGDFEILEFRLEHFEISEAPDWETPPDDPHYDPAG